MIETMRDDAPSTNPPDGHPHKRRPPVIPAVILLAIIGGLVFLFLYRSQPEKQVRRLIDAQLKLAAGGRFDDLWQDTLSLHAKEACPKDSFVGALDQLRASQPNFWTLIAYHDLHISVQGDRAIVTYVITFNGTPIEEATPQNPDIYTRATATVYGETLTKEEQLRRLESLREQAYVVGKEYEKEKREINQHGDIRLQDAIKDHWYDDLDSHVRCGG
jgi:hypothetical protein